MDWWEDMELCPEELGSGPEDEDPDAKHTSRVRITCVPAQHNSGEWQWRDRSAVSIVSADALIYRPHWY